MDLFEAMEHRHAVRSYEDRPIAPEAREALLACIAQCNRESGLHIQLVLDEPRGFGGLPAHYGKFSGVKNYIALIGKKSPNLEEACGYYGEKIVLRAQQLGLNTCWVAMTYSKVKTAFQIAPGEKLCLVIAVGHGTTQGAGHPVKQPEEVSKADSPVPDWFQRGVRAALLAPTAMNQQKFTFKAAAWPRKPEPAFTPRWTWALPNTILKSGRGPRSSAGLPDREPVFRQPPGLPPLSGGF